MYFLHAHLPVGLYNLCKLWPNFLMEQTSSEVLTWHRSIFWKHHFNVSFNICQGVSMSWKTGQGMHRHTFLWWWGHFTKSRHNENVSALLSHSFLGDVVNMLWWICGYVFYVPSADLMWGLQAACLKSTGKCRGTVCVTQSHKVPKRKKYRHLVHSGTMGNKTRHGTEPFLVHQDTTGRDYEAAESSQTGSQWVHLWLVAPHDFCSSWLHAGADWWPCSVLASTSEAQPLCVVLASTRKELGNGVLHWCQEQ